MTVESTTQGQNAAPQAESVATATLDTSVAPHAGQSLPQQFAAKPEQEPKAIDWQPTPLTSLDSSAIAVQEEPTGLEAGFTPTLPNTSRIDANESLAVFEQLTAQLPLLPIHNVSDSPAQSITALDVNATRPASVPTGPTPRESGLFNLLRNSETPSTPAQTMAPTTTQTAATSRRSTGISFGGSLWFHPNRPPTAAPTSNSQNPNTGVITGNLNATDPDNDKLYYKVVDAPDHGTVVVNSAGAYTYTPDATTVENGGTDSFTVAVSDRAPRTGFLWFLRPRGKTTNVTVPITVSSVNEDPVVSGEAVVGAADPQTGAVSIDPPVTDPDGDALTYTSNGSGTTTTNNDGTITYTPSYQTRHNAAVPAASQTEDVTFTAADGHGGTASFGATVPVAPANQDPTASEPTVGSPDSNGAVTITPAVNDADGDTVTYTSNGTGTFTDNGDGTATYTPSAGTQHAAAVPGASQSETIALTGDDGHGGTTTFNVTVPLTPKNTVPTTNDPTIAVPDAGTGAVSGSLTGTDVDHDTLTYSGTTTDKGAVVVNSDGTFTYIPSDQARYAAGDPNATDATKTDTFTITANDGHGGTTTKDVTVDVAPSDTLYFTTSGFPARTLTSADGTQTTYYSRTFDITNGFTTYVTTVDSTTGESTRTSVPGFVTDAPVTSRDGTTTTYTSYQFDATYVTAVDTATGTTNGSSTLPGSLTGTPTTSSDGTATTYTTQLGATTYVTAVDTTTGTTNGSTTLSGELTGTPTTSSDGTTTTYTTEQYNSSTGYTTYVTAVDTTTGTTNGSSTLPGHLSGSVTNSDGTTTYTTGVNNETYVTVVNNATGTTTRTTAIPGELTGLPVINNDGTTTYTSEQSDYNESTGYWTYTTYVTIVDDTTGTIKGSSTLPGHLEVTSTDGTTTTYTTGQYVNGTTSTYVTALDNGTGTTNGASTLPGALVGQPVTNSDGTSTYVTGVGSNGNHTTYVTAVDNTTGTTLHTTTLPGGLASAPVVSTDGDTTTYTTEHDNTTYVTAVDNTTGTINGSSTLPGELTGTPVTNSDGSITTYVTTTRFAQIGDVTYTTYVTAVDNTTGTTLHTTTLPGTTTIPFEGLTVPPVTSSDGNTTIYATWTGHSTVTAVDNTTGGIKGSSTLPGWVIVAPATSSDGTATTYVTQNGLPATGFTTYVTAVDTTTGTTNGSSTLPGTLIGTPVTSSEGTTTTYATEQYNSNSGYTTYVTAVDTTTGTTNGSSTLPGKLIGTPTSNNDGTTTTYVTAQASTVYVTVVDTTTGTTNGSSTLPGRFIGASSDGTTTTYTTKRSDGNGTYTTYITAIDDPTGTAKGSSTLPGEIATVPVTSGDGTTTIYATEQYNSNTGYTTYVTAVDKATGTTNGSSTLPGYLTTTPVTSSDGTTTTYTTYQSSTGTYTITTVDTVSGETLRTGVFEGDGSGGSTIELQRGTPEGGGTPITP